jgi:hypothetical protein
VNLPNWVYNSGKTKEKNIMDDLISKARNEWSSFQTVFDVFDWMRFIGSDMWCLILIIKTKDENLGAVLHHYRNTIESGYIDRFGNYVAIKSNRAQCISFIEDIFRIKKNYHVAIDDSDCLFLNINDDTVIIGAYDVLEYGRWILLDHEDEYQFEKVDVIDKYELEYLLSQMNQCNYFGFKNFKRTVDIIENTGKYEFLSFLIGIGLMSCPMAYRYTLSYLTYLKNHKNYYNSDLLTMLFRFGFYHDLIDHDQLVTEFTSAFPDHAIYEVMETVYYYEKIEYTKYW